MLVLLDKNVLSYYEQRVLTPRSLRVCLISGTPGGHSRGCATQGMEGVL
jgi:hypothetical protein